MTRKEYFQLLLDSADNGTFPSSAKGSDNTLCLYRGENNKRCAIGLLIKDKDYCGDMECHPFSQFLDKVNIPDQMDIRELKIIQRTHDFIALLDDFSTRFKRSLYMSFPNDLIEKEGEYYVA